MNGSGQSAGEDIPFSPPERFELKRKIGSGGMGSVYEAWDRDNNVRVALKTGRTREADALTRFKAEFRSLAEVVHANLVGLYEMISTGDQWFFSMEYVEGTDCLSWVRESSGWGSESRDEGTPAGSDELATQTIDGPPVVVPERRLPAAPLAFPQQFDRLRYALSQIVHGLDHLHSFGKLHCDIKPSNVYVTPEGRVVILDFGLVRDASFHPLWEKKQIAGTRGYMSPEQSRGETLSPATDWYALGVMLFEAITGRLPAERDHHACPPDVPHDLEQICTGLLDPDPARRLDGAAVLERLDVPHSPVGPGSAFRRRRTRRLIGRDEEIAVLEDAFRQAAGGQAIVVFVHGESGMGKSELCRHFASSLSKVPDTIVITGRCYEQESVPFKAVDGLADMLGAWLKSLDTNTAAACEPRNSHALTRIFPVLSHPAFRGAGREPEGDPVELRRRAFRAFRELLARIGDHKRLVLMIDDLQWGDLDSAALLREILRPPDSPDLMLILCYRTEDRKSPCVTALYEAETPGTTEIHLRPFDREKSLRLAHGLLSREDPDWSARAEAIADECGGSPYLAIELAQHAGTQIGSASLDDVLWERIEALPGEARRFLEIVSVAARSIHKKDAFTAAGLHVQDPAVISLLRGNRLVRATSREDSVETYHDRIRETVTSRISKERLKSCHRSVAVALEHSGAADAEQLALHFDRGGERERALRYYAESGEAAAASLAFERAVYLYTRSLELLSEGVETENVSRRNLLIGLARSFANSGRGKEAATNYELAAAGTSDSLEALSLRQQAAYQYCISGYLDEGREVFRDVLKAAGQKLPPVGIRIVPLLLWSALRLRFTSLRYREPRSVPPAIASRADTLWCAATGFGMVDLVGGAYFSDRAAIEALGCGDPQRTLRALAWRACVIANRGLHTAPEVEKLLEACREIQRRHPGAYGEGMIEMATGISNFHMGRRRFGLEHLLAAEDRFVSECPGTYWERTTVRIFICFCLFNRCQLSDLGRRVQAMMRDSRDRGDRFTYALVGTAIAHLPHLAAGNIAEARATIDDAVAGWQQQGITAPKIYAMWATHQIHYYGDEKSLPLREVESMSAEARGTLLSRIEGFQMGFLAVRARLALGLAEKGIDRKKNLALAAGEAKRLVDLNLTAGQGIGFGLASGVHALRGDRTGAILNLTKGVKKLEAEDLALFGLTMRLRLGQVTEGEAGLAMEREAFERLRGNGVSDPYRMTTVWVPALRELIQRPQCCAE